ncbi:DUF2922 domain-containing protein [Enterococcus sp. AZ163]|uniref:DUF2922 domain-containing protein n=1 Tax=Enterococcus sp. AZ163 TaxID=2774638 RepID=UPI003D278E0C
MLSLVATFENSDGSRQNWTFKNPDPNKPAAEIRAALEAMANLPLFEKDGVRLFTKVISAKFVETIERPLFDFSKGKVDLKAMQMEQSVPSNTTTKSLESAESSMGKAAQRVVAPVKSTMKTIKETVTTAKPAVETVQTNKPTTKSPQSVVASVQVPKKSFEAMIDQAQCSFSAMTKSDQKLKTVLNPVVPAKSAVKVPKTVGKSAVHQASNILLNPAVQAMQLSEVLAAAKPKNIQSQITLNQHTSMNRPVITPPKSERDQGLMEILLPEETVAAMSDQELIAFVTSQLPKGMVLTNFNIEDLRASSKESSPQLERLKSQLRNTGSGKKKRGKKNR